MHYHEGANCSKNNDGPNSDVRMLPHACQWERGSTASSYRCVLRQGALAAAFPHMISALQTWSKVSSHGLGTSGGKLGLYLGNFDTLHREGTVRTT